jgi:hypothetical protein
VGRDWWNLDVVIRDVGYHRWRVSESLPSVAERPQKRHRKKEESMRTSAAKWSLILLCFATAGAVGGRLYEHMVPMLIWALSPPMSFSIIQSGTGVPLQNFWIPIHVAITLFLLLSLVLTWQERKARRFLLIGFGSYLVMRV